jgi:hypothetical protein
MAIEFARRRRMSHIPIRLSACREAFVEGGMAIWLSVLSWADYEFLGLQIALMAR